MLATFEAKCAKCLFVKKEEEELVPLWLDFVVKTSYIRCSFNSTDPFDKSHQKVYFSKLIH